MVPPSLSLLQCPVIAVQAVPRSGRQHGPRHCWKKAVLFCWAPPSTIQNKFFLLNSVLPQNRHMGWRWFVILSHDFFMPICLIVVGGIFVDCFTVSHFLHAHSLTRLLALARLDSPAAKRNACAEWYLHQLDEQTMLASYQRHVQLSAMPPSASARVLCMPHCPPPSLRCVLLSSPPPTPLEPPLGPKRGHTYRTGIGAYSCKVD